MYHTLLIATSQTLNPRPTFHSLARTVYLLFLFEFLHLHALYIPNEFCGWGHLAWLTAGSCFWVHMGIEGNFFTTTSCVVLWCCIVSSIQHYTELHIRQTFSKDRIVWLSFPSSTIFVFLPWKITTWGTSMLFLEFYTWHYRTQCTRTAYKKEKKLASCLKPKKNSPNELFQ